jgi:hypothetical protein
LSLGGDVWQVEHGTPSLRANNGIANTVLPLPQKKALEIKSDNVKSALTLSLFIFSIVKLLQSVAVYRPAGDFGNTPPLKGDGWEGDS